MRGEYSLADIRAVTEGNNNNGFNDGFGAWWIVLFLIFGWGRNGFGGNGGGQVGDNYVLASDFSQLSRQLSDGLAGLERKGDIINGGLCDGFYAQNTTMLNGFSGVNSNISNGVYNLTSAITTNGFETRNAITQDTIANMQNANAIQSQLASCCCDIKGLAKDNRYETLQNINMLNNSINSGFVSVNQANCLNTRDIIASQEAGTRQILQALCDDKLERKNEQIALLQTQLNNAELRASQEAQSREIINTIRPCPIPSYASCNPWGCNCNQGCNCGM